MEFTDIKINKVICLSDNGSKIMYTHTEKLQFFNIPSSYNFISVLFGNTSEDFSINLLKKINDPTSWMTENEKEKETKIRQSGIKYQFVDESPKLVYMDITETEMFGFPEIKQNVLTAEGNGLWANHGIRKFKIFMSDIAEKDDGWNIDIDLYFNKKNNTEIEKILMNTDTPVSNEKENDTSYETYAFIDTDLLGKQMAETEQKCTFSGWLEVQFKINDLTINNVTYCFPVELLMNNTVYQPGKNSCVPLSKHTVSIDFGTSSSCVAVSDNNGIELLTLSARGEGRDDINIYENPTCIMLYRWEEIYRQWKIDNTRFPLILKGSLEEEERGDRKVQYDFGYSVKNCLNKVSDKELNSIVSEIKMIPKMLQRDEQLTVRPLVIQNKKRIKIVDAYNKQDDESFDAVAFYGYILGKAINRVDKNRLYTKYQVTYPVKFNEEVKKKMCMSLECGLKRSLPLPLQKALDIKGNPVFKVEAKYPEPVAYIGSICGKYLKLEKENPAAKLFAVYDFGGGTLDYSFGIFAPVTDEPGCTCIHILGVDGDSNIGGELLIKRMSYWVYASSTNRLQFIEKKIPFEKPAEEVLPDSDQLAELLNRSASAKSNVRKINERITRHIFEGRYALDEDEPENVQLGKRNRVFRPSGAKSYTNTTDNTKSLGALKDDEIAGEVRKISLAPGNVEYIEFLDSNNEEVRMHVSYDLKELNEKLEEIFLENVRAFKASLIRAFENRESVLKQCGICEFQIKDVHIFEAGNGSRSQILRKIMKKEFPENEILLVDETSSEFMTQKNGEVSQGRAKQVAVTPKTAVAIGQLKLNAFDLDISYIMDGHPFNWYIGTLNGARNEFELVIDKVNLNENWVKYKRINSSDMKIFYTDTYVKDADDLKLKNYELDEYIDEEYVGKYLYIKIEDSDTILCCVCDKNAQLNEMKENFRLLLQ